jgi:excisionase family DNA binding protein
MVNSFEATFIKSMQIACLASIVEEGLLSERQYGDLVEKIGENFGKSNDSERSRNEMTMNVPESRYIVNGDECPIWEKDLLTIDEAAELFGIGTNKLRAMTSEDECDFVVWVGTKKRLIKRKRFTEFLESQYSI